MPPEARAALVAAATPQAEADRRPASTSPATTGRLSVRLVDALAALALAGDDNIAFVLSARAVVDAWLAPAAPSDEALSGQEQAALATLRMAVQREPSDQWLGRVTVAATNVVLATVASVSEVAS